MTEIVFVIKEPDPKGNYDKVFWIEIYKQLETDTYAVKDTYSYKMWRQDTVIENGHTTTRTLGSITKLDFDSMLSVLVDALTQISKF